MCKYINLTDFDHHICSSKYWRYRSPKTAPHWLNCAKLLWLWTTDTFCAVFEFRTIARAAVARAYYFYFSRVDIWWRSEPSSSTASSAASCSTLARHSWVVFRFDWRGGKERRSWMKINIFSKNYFISIIFLYSMLQTLSRLGWFCLCLLRAF